MTRTKDTQVGRHRFANLSYFRRTHRNRDTTLYQYPLCKYGTIIGGK